MIKKTTVTTIKKQYENNEKITMLTAYDYSTAKYVDEAGVEMILVGDSLGNVVLGYDTTQKVSMEEMLVFVGAVARGSERALIVGDMPFMSCTASIESAMLNIAKMVKAGANAVKIEGCSDHIVEVIKRCTEIGIPVVAHLGFTPQFINAFGGYKIQGKTSAQTLEILKSAKRLEEAGAFAVVLEMVPTESAEYITNNLSIPTIGIGAGDKCSGQVLVIDDILGKFSNYVPTFVRKYADVKSIILNAATEYCNDVKTGKFPSSDECYSLSEEEKEKLYNNEAVKC